MGRRKGRKKIDSNAIYREILTAKFVMVSLDFDSKMPVSNVKLLVETDKEKERFKQGECK